jgi:mono/diheme cytochrome c family protein
MKKATFAVAALSMVLAGSMLFGQEKQAKGGAGDAAKGKDVFESNCSVCHNSDSTETKVGPGLKGLFKKPALMNKKPVNNATVLEMINTGSESGMPPYKDMLTAAEKADVIAFLKTL